MIDAISSNRDKLKRTIIPVFWGLVISLYNPQALAESASVLGSSRVLHLQDAINMAKDNDPWLQSSRYKEQALQANSRSEQALPNPKLTFRLQNLPTDSFDFSQEAMTQAQLGFSQAFPRGDTLELKQKQWQQLSEQQPVLRDDRTQQVTMEVTHRWLDALLAERSIQIIQQDANLFKHLESIAQSSYRSAIGNVRQQDLVRAQLELTRLDERLFKLQEHRDVKLAELALWLMPEGDNVSHFSSFSLPEQLPELNLTDAAQRVFSEMDVRPHDYEFIAQTLLAHPKVASVEKVIHAQKTGIQIAQQSRKPQWSMNATYGYRDEDKLGHERADLLSVGVTVDMPLWDDTRPEQQIQAAIFNAEQIETEKRLLVRTLASSALQHIKNLKNQERQLSLYENQLLAQLHQQSEAALAAYTNDDGDFAEAVRAQIDELNARLEVLTLKTKRLKSIASLNYYFSGDQQTDSDALNGSANNE
ncbi:TolC family protein [Paraneptunicella aestuarii]|uniref:TolC family protein n=1 Tax=Paraneptunicella aestuarii TaxID=2831148 RepID=UPI001E621867|nr:TolC family protein [Paraneptunicella aestuarii]UAA38630.1 TolC family protein [Paraneptunicella aestuarii]